MNRTRGGRAVTGIDYRRLYDYRLDGTDQRTRRAAWTEIAVWLHQRMGSPPGAVKAIAGGITDAGLPSGYFDGAVMSNLLEHLPMQETVAAALARLRQAMAPGGTVAVMGPNFRYCAREYFDCADHTLALTHVAVGEHLHAAGFSLGYRSRRCVRC
jgi:hypothetical protein